ncbi:hypothetical protein FSB78_01405 [Sphingomonas ginsenosidivorax]|uniref:Sulfatase-like hydrolase/transferase n=1 Tax=Sphingomonas ginsenosidivorax TaxID=862135 RepID=A0A5C6U9X2_9SPHN|nr:hypothetical protein [Sphingomonas ginsenosidivorax]TXC69767.1 hypothetical protein FSB78_01405 [Sphingomonas ginsenosidivorax]
MTELDPESVLFITLDSCRFDTMANAGPLAMRAVAPMRPAQAPSYFTYGSHCAMFVGFTPVATLEPVAMLNPKAAKLFKLVGAGHPGKGGEGFELAGANIIEGFANRGHSTIGSGAVGWFNPDTPTGVHLGRPFQHFLYDGAPGAVERQVAWIGQQIDAAPGPVFTFLNCAETHVPYWHQGAAWPYDDNCCEPFQTVDRRDECAARQASSLRHIDAVLAPLIARFLHATILICGDHGDAWGEDGIWEHGVPHEKVLTVPLMIRHRGDPV